MLIIWKENDKDGQKQKHCFGRLNLEDKGMMDELGERRNIFC